MACSTVQAIPTTQSSATATPPFSAGQVGTAVAMTLTGSAPEGREPTASLSPGTPTSSSHSFVPGDPTATPLGSEITDPNFIEGLAAFKAQDFEQAAALMSAVIASDPHLAPPYRYRATSYRALGDCPAGLIDANQALSINPEYAEAWAARGLLHACLGDQLQSWRDYQKALSIDPSLAFIHHNLAVDYYEVGDFQKALEEYSLAVAIDPNRASAWSGKAEALGQMGRYVECIENATKAIEIDPQEWLAYTDRATCSLSIENYDAAAADYKIYLDHHLDDSSAWYNYGISQRHTDDLQGAVESYTRALEIDPSYYPAYINRANIYRDLTKYQEALDDYNDALAYGEIPLAYSGRADTYYAMGKYERAIADYKTSLSLFPNNAHCYCFLTFSYFELERYEEALDAAESTHEIDPSCGGQRLLEIQARSYYGLEEYDQALEYIDKALDMGQFSLGYYYRGLILQAMGRNAEAIQYLEQFLATIQSRDVWAKEIADAEARLRTLQP
jgi:tetratricopeptide (TPR) repeat protein